MTHEQTMHRLWDLLRPYRLRVALTVLLGALTVIAAMGLMSSAGYLVARAAERPLITDLVLLFVAVRFFGLSRATLRYAERLVSHDMTFRLLMRLRVWFYERLEPLAPARLLHHRLGDLLSRIVSDVDTLQTVYLRVFAPTLVAVSVIGTTTWALAFFDLTLAAVVLGFLVVTGVAVPVLMQRLGREPGHRQIEERAELSSRLVDAVRGSAELLAFGRTTDTLREIHARNEALGRLQARQATLTGMQTGLSDLLTNVGICATLLLCIPLVVSGTIAGPILALLVLGVMSSFEALGPLGAAFQFVEQSKRASARLFEVVDAEPDVRDPRTPVWLDGEPGTVSFEDVCFSYGSQGGQVRDISFTVEPGQRLAIVGPSGAGKSTLLHLLMRFYDPDEGRVSIAGVDVRELTQEHLRAQVALVSQHAYIFNTTLRQNLLLASPNATDALLHDALRRAQLTPFVDALPEGLETFVGEHGARLSGGERQRVAVARAFLKDAPIVVLDEATANLDTPTEREVLGALNELMRGRASIVVTHRLVGMEEMDEIVVLESGRIVERGAHAVLCRAGGIYREMIELQNRML